MVQGKTKGLQAKAGQSKHQAAKAASHTKKGKRTIAPKKPSLIKQAAMQKDLTAKINKSIEQQLVASASSGKLTIMKNTLPEGVDASSSKKPKPGSSRPGK